MTDLGGLDGMLYNGRIERLEEKPSVLHGVDIFTIRSMFWLLLPQSLAEFWLHTVLNWTVKFDRSVSYISTAHTGPSLWL